MVEAPVSIIWKLLTNVAVGAAFSTFREECRAAGMAAKGQRMRGETGPRWLHLGVTFEYTLIDETNHQLEVDARLPLGITVHETLNCVPLADTRCRVHYHCDFAFLAGVRGRLTRVVLSRGLKEGPADSLSRLKRAAEQEHCYGHARARA